MRAEVLAIGDEITTGQRLDTNSQWLSQRLTELGLEVAFHTTVGDELDDHVAVLKTAFERADIVVSTGGLGPTADDLARQALAAATKTSLERDADSLAHIEHLFASRGRAMPERNRAQADFPTGATPIPNPHGTAPGIVMQVERAQPRPCILFALPGVPAELYEMWEATVAPHILRLLPEPIVIRHRCIKCFGIGESDLEAMLPDVIRRGRQPKVGITVSEATITLRITATGSDEATTLESMEPTIATIRKLLGDLVFSEEDEELQHVVSRLLGERNQTIAVAEWATTGKIAEWLSCVENEPACLKNSLVISSLDQVRALFPAVALPESANSHDPVTAEAMAAGIREVAGADCGLAVAAYPPIPFQKDSRVAVAIATPEKTESFLFGCTSHPAIRQTRTAKQALNAVRLRLTCD